MFKEWIYLVKQEWEYSYDYSLNDGLVFVYVSLTDFFSGSLGQEYRDKMWMSWYIMWCPA